MELTKDLLEEVYGWLRYHLPLVDAPEHNSECGDANSETWEWAYPDPENETNPITRDGRYEIVFAQIEVHDYGSSCETCNRDAQASRNPSGKIVVRLVGDPSSEVEIDTEQHDDVFKGWEI